MKLRREIQAFTLVELVLTLVLLGVLAATAASLFSRPDAMALLTARDQLLATALLAQKQALAHSGSSEPTTLTLVQTNSDWRYEVRRGLVLVAERTAQRAGGALLLNGTVLANGSTVWNYSTAGALPANQALLFRGEQNYSLCLAASGFAYAASCQP